MGIFLIFSKLGLTGHNESNVLVKLAAGFFAFVAHRNFTFRVADSSAARHPATRYFLLLALSVPVASAGFSLPLLLIAEPVTAKFIADVVCVALPYGFSECFIFSGQRGCSERSHCSGADG